MASSSSSSMSRLASCLARHRGVGPLQRAVHAGDRRVQQFGDLARLPLQHVAQDQHGALLRRQVLQGGDEGQANRLALGQRLRRIARVRRNTVAGNWFDERTLRQGRADEPIGGSRRTGHLHRQGAALPAAQRVEAHVAGDAIEPGTHLGTSFEAVVGAPCSGERLLHGILGVERRPEHSVAEALELGAMRGREHLIERRQSGRRRGPHRWEIYPPRRRPGT